MGCRIAGCSAYTHVIDVRVTEQEFADVPHDTAVGTAPTPLQLWCSRLMVLLMLIGFLTLKVAHG